MARRWADSCVPVSIGSTVFIDANNNGVQEAGEAGIADQTVTLYAADGTTVIATTTTDTNGNYLFTGLAPGDYRVGMNAPTAYPTSSTDIATSTADNDTDLDDNGIQTASGAPVLSPVITLTSGIESTTESTTIDPTGGAQDTATGDANGNMTVDFGFYAPVNVSGNVFIDTNGTLGDGTVNGSQYPAADNTLYVVLVDAAGNIAGSAEVASDGTFSIAGVVPGTYTAIMTTTAPGAIGTLAPTTASAPPGYTNVGENLGTTAGSDGTNNGIFTTSIVVASTDVPNVNFGLDQPPVASNVSVAATTNPGGATQVAVPGLSATDPEQGALTLPGSTITIETIPLKSTGDLYYNGVLVVAGQVIPNFDPALLKVDPADGAQTMVFTYSVVDAAGLKSAPATVTIPFTAPSLPINLIEIGGSQMAEQINVFWKTSEEKDFSHFELLRSADAKEFVGIATVSASNKGYYSTSDTQPIEGINYYRLKMVDLDGTFSYSKVIRVKYEKAADFVKYENPATNGVIKLHTNMKNPTFRLINGLGIELNTVVWNSGDQYEIKANHVVAGIYYLNIISNDGKMVTKKVLMN